MRVSKLTLLPETAKQMSLEHHILKYIQDHPDRMRNTNNKILSNQMVISGYQSHTIALKLGRMINNQMLYRDGGKRHANYRINYYHKDVPQDIKDKAPKEIKKAIADLHKGLKENQFINEFGCKVTMPEAPKVTKEIAVPVKVEKSKDGHSLNVTINLTLNLQ